MTLQKSQKGFDAYIAYYPDYPVRADSRFSEGYNPKVYFERTGRKIQEGDLIQRVYIWGGQQLRFGRSYVNLSNDCNHYLPLRDLIFGKEGQNVQVGIWGRIFTFRCAEQQSKNKYNFEEFQAKSYYAYPEHGEKTCTLESLSLNRFKETLAGTRQKPFSQDIFFNTGITIPECTNQKLKEMYQRGKYLGNGGDGTVVKVTTKAGRVRALKISTEPIKHPGVYAAIGYIVQHDLSPHLTKVYKLMRIPSCGWKNQLTESDQDFVEMPKKDEDPKIKTGTEMEIIDSDLYKVYDGLTDKERCAVDLQMRHIRQHLRQMGVTIEDCWGIYRKNVFIKKLDDSVTCNGKALMDYDYWKYTLNGQEFYVPKMPFIIKFGDYDLWKISSTLPCQKIPAFASYEQEELIKAARLFPKPKEENAKILDMGGT